MNDDEPLEGYDRVYVTDPFGNRIELIEHLEHRKLPESVREHRGAPG